MDSVFRQIQNEVKAGVEAAAREAGTYITEQIDLTFEYEGMRGGHDQWAPTTEIALSTRHTYPHGASLQVQEQYRYYAKTLVDTGALHEDAREVKSSKFVEDDYVLIFDPSVPYADILNNGGTITIDGESYVMEAREFMFFTQYDVEHLTELVTERLPGG